MKWVTREHPKTDRIACPWLIRKFIDPEAELLFVPADQVLEVAEREGAIPYDARGKGKYDHREGKCTFEVLIEEFNLDDPALRRLADIVHGADTRDRSRTVSTGDELSSSAGARAMRRQFSRQQSCTHARRKAEEARDKQRERDKARDNANRLSVKDHESFSVSIDDLNAATEQYFRDSEDNSALKTTGSIRKSSDDDEEDVVDGSVLPGGSSERVDDRNEVDSTVSNSVEVQIIPIWGRNTERVIRESSV